MKFIDLFCGIGGFHVALEKLGHKCVLASDSDKHCREVYKENFGIDPVNDVKDINTKDLEDFDILCAGFPCQPFSNGGKKMTFQDERGLLFDEIIRIAKVKKPKFMFLENVKHILKVGNGEVIEYIKRRIDAAGYNLKIVQISPHNYGIPQQRERVYFICTLKSLGDFELKLDEHVDKIDFEKYLEKDYDKKYKVEDRVLNVLEAWEEMIKIFEKDEKISPTILINDFYRGYTEEEIDSFPNWKKEYMIKNKPLIEKYRKQFDKWYNKYEDILTDKEIFGKLEWQVGKIKKNDSIFDYFIQVRQSGIRVKKAKYFPTLVAINQTPIYGKEKRYITPRECARLQSFPESFIIHKDDKRAYKQFGNAINVDNAHMVMKNTLSNFVGKKL